MKKYQKMFEKIKKEDQTTGIEEDHTGGEMEDIPKSYMQKSEKQVETVILAGMRFHGDVKGSHNLFLNGEFDGTVDLRALLFIGQSGRLVGEVKAERVIIEGEVEGTITANDKIELREGGKCKGDILAPSVMISDKAFFQGQVTMTTEEEKTEDIKSSYQTSMTQKNEKSTNITVVDDIAKEKDEEASNIFKSRRRNVLVNDSKE
jgi:cytoskeletal protein CcmA (bactofilin family)